MQIKKHIPNIITLLNLFCGCIAIIFITHKDFQTAFFFVSLGIFLDFFDGFFARLFKVSSPLGLQLDSLADMVTSGVVPGFVMYMMLADFDLETSNLYAYLGFVVTLGACFRLANFNIDTRQTDSFIGLPTPANALFILSLPLILQNENYIFISQILHSTWFLLVVVVLSSYIMNAEIPLFSLKIKKFTIKDNLLQIVFLALSIILLLFLQFLGVAIVIIMYVLLSVFQNIFFKKELS
jgi:CDP-diacylglycerol--serine O-phosphatidyltransferase